MDVFNLKALAIAFLILVPLERLLPLHPDQKIFRRAFALDLIYALINGIIIKAMLVLLMAVTMVSLGQLIPSALSEAVAAQPLWLQVSEIILIADVGFYFAHRAFHAVPLLWRFHAVHHSIEDLDWLAAHRVHFLDQSMTKAASLLPVALLGFQIEAIGLWALIFYAHGLLLHANLRMRIGPLRWLIASPQFHHWHHANEPSTYNRNFAGQLSFLDMIFGTLHLPGDKVPECYGIDDPVAGNYLQQTIQPFLPENSANVVARKA